jgi:hypothetical protein
MNFPWKPLQLVGHWVPGFVVLTMLLLADAHVHHAAALWRKITNSLGSDFAIILAIIIPFVIGQFLDSLRDLGEHLVDKISQVNWKKLKSLSDDKQSRFEDYYFVYYVFNMNLSIGLTVGYLLTFILRIFPLDYFYSFTSAVLIVVLVFSINACTLRVEIRKFLDVGK